MWYWIRVEDIGMNIYSAEYRDRWKTIERITYTCLYTGYYTHIYFKSPSIEKDKKQWYPSSTEHNQHSDLSL